MKLRFAKNLGRSLAGLVTLGLVMSGMTPVAVWADADEDTPVLYAEGDEEGDEEGFEKYTDENDLVPIVDPEEYTGDGAGSSWNYTSDREGAFFMNGQLVVAHAGDGGHLDYNMTKSDKVVFEFITYVDEQFDQITINGVDYSQYIPRDIYEMLEAVDANDNGYTLSFSLPEIDYAEEYEIEVFKLDIPEEEKSTYTPVGYFSWTNDEEAADEENYIPGTLIFKSFTFDEDYNSLEEMMDANRASMRYYEIYDLESDEEEETSDEDDDSGEASDCDEDDDSDEAINGDEDNDSDEAVNGDEDDDLDEASDDDEESLDSGESDELGDESEDFEETPVLVGGYAVLPAGGELTVQILPQTGKQLKALWINENRIIVEDAVGEYTFEIPGGDFTLHTEFVDADNTVVIDGETVTAASVDLDYEDLLYGTSLLKVFDADLEEEQKAAFLSYASTFAQENETAAFETAFSMTVNRIVNKANQTDSWSEEIGELEGVAFVTLSLANAIKDPTKLMVVRELADGEYDAWPVVYDADTNTISFCATGFSRFAVISGVELPTSEIDIASGEFNKGDITPADFDDSSDIKAGDNDNTVLIIILIASGVVILGAVAFFIIRATHRKK